MGKESNIYKGFLKFAILPLTILFYSKFLLIVNQNTFFVLNLCFFP